MSQAKTNFPLPEIPDSLSGYFRKYHDRILIDESLSDLEVLLLCIHLIEKQNNKSGAIFDEVKSAFVNFGRIDRPNFGVAVHNGVKKKFIINSNGLLYFQIKGLKEVEKILGYFGKSPVTLIKSGQYFSAIKLFEEFLIAETLGNELLICDTHISPESIFPLSILKGAVKNIKILTSNIYEEDKLKVYLQKLSKESQLKIEIKKSFRIHDRYIISNGKCWSLGASIKDFGNKDSILTDISHIGNSLKDLFEERWNNSEAILV